MANVSQELQKLILGAIGDPSSANELIADLQNTGISSVNGLTGDVVFAAGSNVTLTPSGNTITITSSGSGGGGVTALNSLTGSLTLVAGSGITVTPAGSNITITATGGSGANVTLSNLTSPTAINHPLTFATGVANAGLATPVSTGSTNSEAISIFPGNSLNGLGGTFTLSSGSAFGTGSGGNVFMSSGSATSGTGGYFQLYGGSTLTGQAGSMTIGSGSANSNAGGDSTQGMLFLTSDNNIAIQAGGSSSSPTYIPSLQFFESTDTFFVALKASNSIAANTTWTLPLADGAANAALTTNGSGQLSFTAQSQILALASNASVGGAVSEALTVPGLLTTDTILSVSQKTQGGATRTSLPLIGWDTVVTNGLTAHWVADPGAGAVVLVAIKR